MKTFNQFFVVALCSFLLLGTISSCKKDPVKGCTDTNAENYNSNADEDDGSCTYARDKFIGSYQANENCATGNYSWSMTVTESSSSVNGIILGNLGDFGENVLATVSGSNLTINDTKNGITFSGSGTINGSSLTIIYNTTGAFVDDCTATCIKQ